MYFKVPLNIPAGIRYISEWLDFKLSNYTGHNIIHKQLPGCGFTEFTLRCPEPVVLCSPRKMLMQNKEEQHRGDVYLVESQFDRDLNVDTDTSKSRPKDEISKEIEKELGIHNLKEHYENSYYLTLFQEISNYLNNLSSNKSPKIIVTYDSAYLVKKVLEQMGIIDQFWFVVDEFQSLLEDARFKADTELNFLTNVLPGVKNVIFVSATPMLDRYIQQIPQLNTIPYYEMDWGSLDKTRIKKPDLKIRTMNSIITKMSEIIQSYLQGNFEKVIVERGGYLEEIVSTECVIYVNSVSHIISIIKKLGLDPNQVNILCSNTPENQAKIDKRLGKRAGFKIGRVPLKGEQHKMFTFCTRTVYLGADFYSTNARSFIFSDANSDCLAVDISMDLAQILGRQRLEENPWHNSAEFFYRSTCDYKKMTWEDLQKILDIKTKKTENLLSAFDTAKQEAKQDLAEQYQRETRRELYKNNYVAVNQLEDGTLIPEKNILVRINDERSFDIQQVDYADRFSVFCSIKNQFGTIGADGDILRNFFFEYDQLTTYVDKIRIICEFIFSNPEIKDAVINNLSDSDKVKQQLITIGPERIRALGYNLTKINKEMGITIFDRSTLDSIIFSTFLVGNRYSKKYIKETLQSIYQAADFHGKAKANDLENWFTIKTCKVLLEDGTRPDGFEIIKIK